MLTPSFEARQDKESIILTIRVPYVKISEAEIDIDGTNFKFYCRPYYLWLEFSGELVEDGKEKAQYEVSTGNIIVTVSKKVKGEEFKNLDMLTTLLGGKKEVDLRSVAAKPLIEVISDNESISADSAFYSQVSADSAYYSQDSIGSECGADDDLFTVSKEKCTLKSAEDDSDGKDKNDEDVTALLAGQYRYGFADQHTGVLAKLQDEIPSIIDCPDPDNMNNEERRFARLSQEQLNFEPEHYLADLMDGDNITNLLKYAFKPDTSFTDEEKTTLKDLPNKEYILL
uniref:CS domain-containing protein n=1 Tax=Amphimedon queenslandica TaxID=400682 RepID=A0A1X7UK40_AMPQE